MLDTQKISKNEADTFDMIKTELGDNTVITRKLWNKKATLKIKLYL